MTTPDYGADLKPGDAHYRAYVGPPKDYDIIGGQQFSLLLAAGLRETHLVADVGCGSLRGGRLLIPFLRAGHYYGIEPNSWLIQEGIDRELGRSIIELKQPVFSEADDFSLASFGVEFDFVLAQSVFSHTHRDMAEQGFAGIGAALGQTGVLLATFVQGSESETGTGWVYPDCVEFTWPDVQEMLAAAGLYGFRVDWPHPRQKWFVAARESGRATAFEISVSIRSPIRRI